MKAAFTRISGMAVSGRSASARKGFTLLEVLLSVALVALMLVALNTFIFSMGELWGRNADARLFEQHARAVTDFLQDELRAAVMPPATKSTDTPIAAREITPDGAATADLLTFLLPDGRNRLLNWSGPPLPEVVCSLQVREGQGLLILWHSRVETDFSNDAPRETVISPFVTGLAYDYYDATFKTWSTETELKHESDGTTIITPQRLRLKFAYKTYTYDGIITLPIVTEGLPAY